MFFFVLLSCNWKIACTNQGSVHIEFKRLPLGFQILDKLKHPFALKIIPVHDSEMAPPIPELTSCDATPVVVESLQPSSDEVVLWFGKLT